LETSAGYYIIMIYLKYYKSVLYIFKVIVHNIRILSTVFFPYLHSKHCNTVKQGSNFIELRGFSVTIVMIYNVIDVAG